MPSDPQHEAIMPYTPLGKETMLAHKSGFGTNIAPITDINDPFDTCDPIGFPRIELFNLRAVQIVQTKDQVLMLYQNTRIFRNIWTDGRDLPKEITEPRWFGYSVGKWVDPTTLVVTTTGLDDSTWIDNVGRPHSSDLVVEETFHRVDELNLDLTMKITDPTMYTQPWYPLKNFRLGMNSPSFDIREMICSVSQQALYNELYKDAAAQGAGNPAKSGKQFPAIAALIPKAPYFRPPHPRRRRVPFACSRLRRGGPYEVEESPSVFATAAARISFRDRSFGPDLGAAAASSGL